MLEIGVFGLSNAQMAAVWSCRFPLTADSTRFIMMRTAMRTPDSDFKEPISPSALPSAPGANTPYFKQRCAEQLEKELPRLLDACQVPLSSAKSGFIEPEAQTMMAEEQLQEEELQEEEKQEEEEETQEATIAASSPNQELSGRCKDLSLYLDFGDTKAFDRFYVSNKQWLIGIIGRRFQFRDRDVLEDIYDRVTWKLWDSKDAGPDDWKFDRSRGCEGLLIWMGRMAAISALRKETPVQVWSTIAFRDGDLRSPDPLPAGWTEPSPRIVGLGFRFLNDHIEGQIFFPPISTTDELREQLQKVRDHEHFAGYFNVREQSEKIDDKSRARRHWLSISLYTTEKIDIFMFVERPGEARKELQLLVSSTEKFERPPEDLLDFANETLPRFLADLADLNHQQRCAIVCCRILGHSLKDYGSPKKMTTNQVDGHLRLGLKKLAKKWKWEVNAVEALLGYLRNLYQQYYHGS